ncbi:MAG: leucyl aminopeptidase [Chitinophagales bacterium]
MQLYSTPSIYKPFTCIYLADEGTDWEQSSLSSQQIAYIHQCIEQKINFIHLNESGHSTFIVIIEAKADVCDAQEQWRNQGAKLSKSINDLKLSGVNLCNLSRELMVTWYFAEGLALSSYQFLKYRKNSEKEKNLFEHLYILENSLSKPQVEELQYLVEGVFFARDLVNEPLSYLTASKFGELVQHLGAEVGFEVEVWDKAQIEAAEMGGILAVNRGSIDPPSFSILKWQPDNAVNEQPIVLIGKGVVYDTGGLSLKPTENSMDFMKSDMGGGAAVVGALYAIAKNKLPLNVIGLVPATDNRPGQNAYVPGDVVLMHSKLTVEVLNTDAEGRMLLADALSYAQSLNPKLVIDIATLTGAALMTIGTSAMLMMGNAEDSVKTMLRESSFNVHERLVEMPLWEDYKDMLKSDIADLKNIGGKFAGAITAGKFLEHFTNYPWIHIDMAPMGWNFQTSGYRIKNGSGAGVRLFYDFLKKQLSN